MTDIGQLDRDIRALKALAVMIVILLFVEFLPVSEGNDTTEEPAPTYEIYDIDAQRADITYAQDHDFTYWTDNTTDVDNDGLYDALEHYLGYSTNERDLLVEVRIGTIPQHWGIFDIAHDAFQDINITVHFIINGDNITAVPSDRIFHPLDTLYRGFLLYLQETVEQFSEDGYTVGVYYWDNETATINMGHFYGYRWNRGHYNKSVGHTIAHELGHGLRLVHTNNSYDLMHPDATKYSREGLDGEGPRFLEHKEYLLTYSPWRVHEEIREVEPGDKWDDEE